MRPDSASWQARARGSSRSSRSRSAGRAARESLRAFSPALAAVREAAGRVGDVREAEDGLHLVVQLRRPAFEGGGEVAAGEERAEGREGVVPAEVGGGRVAARAAVRDGGAGGPGAGQGDGLVPTLDGALRGDDGGAGGVEAAPALLPDLRAAGPAAGRAGEEGLEPLGETGLAGAVAAEDDGEPRAGGEVEVGGRADAAEAGDGDALEVGRGG